MTVRRRRKRSLAIETLEPRAMMAADTQSPVLASGTWTGVETLLDVAADLKVTFSEPVRAGMSGSVSLFRSSGALVESFGVAVSSALRFDGSILTINPTWNLDGSSRYYVTIDSGSVRDLAGNAFAGIADSATLAFRTDVETRNTLGASSIRDQFPGTAAESVGDHRALYMRATFTDINRAPTMLGDAWADMDDSRQGYIQNSRGIMPVTVTYTPVLTLPFSHQWLSTFDRSVSGLSLLQTAAKAEAAKLGYSTSDYNVFILRVDEPLRDNSSWGGGDSVWLSWDGFPVIVHEAGHALAVGHAKSVDWTGKVTEYGNPLDWMGDGGSLEDVFGVKTQATLKWIDPNDILTNPGPGVYRLHAADSGRQVVGQSYGLSQTIPFDILGSSPTYTLEYRPRQGGILADSVVLLRNDAIIDLTPNSKDGFIDGGLRVGQTIQIPESDAYFTVLSRGDGFIDIAYQQGPFIDNVAPSVTIAASATTVKPSENVTFTADAVDANGDQLVYSWVFGDGVIGAGPTYTRTFAQSAAGTVSLTLTVSDMRGGVATVSASISVGAAVTGSPVTTGTLSLPSLAVPRVAITAPDSFASEGGDTATFTVSRIGTALTEALTVGLSYAGTALADFVGLPTVVTIPAGLTQAILTLTPLDDSAIEAVKALTVNLVVGAGYDISSQADSTRVTLGDDDTPIVTIEAVDAIASEPTVNGRDTGLFLISRTGPTDQPLTVYYGVAGSAFNGGDFGRLDGQAIIPAGQSSVAVVINPLDDEVGEQDETVTLTLAAFNDAYSVGKAATARVTIMDNGDLPTVSVWAQVSTSTEGNAGPVLFDVIGGDGGPLTIGYTVAGSATAGTDYQPLSGTITVPAGSGRRTVALPIVTLADVDNEHDESVIITVSPSAAYGRGFDATAQVRIREPIVTSAGDDRVTVSRHFVGGGTADIEDPSENGPKPAVFAISRENTTTAKQALTVTYTLAGSATPGADYTGRLLTAAGAVIATFTPSATNTLTIPADANAVLVELTPVADSVFEGTETIVFSLASVSGTRPWYPLGLNREVVTRLLDKDAGPVQVGFEVTGGTLIGETLDPFGTDRQIAVTLSQAATAPVTVRYRANGGTALGLGADWTFLDPTRGNAEVMAGTLTFAPGETRKTITVRVQPDRIPESQETFDILLEAPQGASLRTGFTTHQGTIYDVVPTDFIKEERWEGTAVYTNNSYDSVAPTYVGYLSGLTTAQGVGDNYSRRLTGVITAPSTGAFTFYIAADERAELYLSTSESPANKALIASTNWTQWFQQWDRYASQKSAAINLVAGQRYYVEVRHLENTVVDHLSVAWTGPGITTITPISAMAPLPSADNRSVRFVTETSTVTEGQTGKVLVALDRVNPTASVTVGVEVVGGSAATGTDYAIASTTITFAPGELTKSIDIGALADSLNEAAESISLRLVTAAGARILSPVDHELTIVDANAPGLSTPTGLVGLGDNVGTVVAQMNATVAAGRTLQSLEIVAGNPRLEGNATAAFAIDGQGQITLANASALPLGSYEIRLAVRATDNLGSSTLGSAIIVINGRRLVEERWDGTNVYSADDWSGPPASTSVLTAFDMPRITREYFSRRVTGVFSPSTTGSYSFWVAADDVSRLTIAPFGDPSSEQVLAGTSSSVGYQAWDAKSGQQSVPAQLVAGERYILRGYMQEFSGMDHLSVAWSGPGFTRQVMPAAAFLPALAESVVGPAVVDADRPGTVASYSLSTAAVTNTGVAATVNAGQITRDPTLGLRGTAVAGSRVAIYEGTALLGHTIAAADGTWAVTTPALADGGHTVRAEVVDPHGNIALTLPATFTVRTKIELADMVLVSHVAGTTRGTATGAAVSSVAGFAGADQGVVVYQTAQGLLAGDVTSGTLHLVTRGPADATTPATATSTFGGISPDGGTVIFGSNDVTAFGNAGAAFIDTSTVSSGPYTDLFAFDRATGTVRLLTAGSTATTSRSRQAQFVGVTADSKHAIYTTDYAENVADFTAPGKQPAAWALVEGGYPTTAGVVRTTSLRAADIDPATLAFTLNGSWISTKNVAATVSAGVAVARGTGTLSFWIQAYDEGLTKAVRLELSDVATGILVKATAAKFTYGTQATYNWSSLGVAGSVATSATTAGYGVSLLEARGAAVTEKMRLDAVAAGIPTADIVAVNLATGEQRLVSHSAAAGNRQSGGANVGNVRLTADGRFVLFTAADARKFGNAGVAFTDSAPAVADLFAANLETGEIRLLSRAVSDASASAGVAVTLLGTTADGTHAVFSSLDATAFGFTDSAPAAADLFGVSLADGTIRLLSRAGAASATTSAGQGVTFEAVSGRHVYFSANDATAFGFTSDGDATKADLFRADIATGTVELISHVATSSTQALNGTFKPGSVTVSPDGRFVAFALNLTSTFGGFTVSQTGEALFLADMQTGAIRMVNAVNTEGTQLSYAAWSTISNQTTSPRFFSADSKAFVWQTSYMGWVALEGKAFATGVSNQFTTAALVLDLGSGLQPAGTAQASRLLSHTAASLTEIAPSVTLVGVSGDGRLAFLSVADVSPFGNDGVAFIDSGPMATDILAVDLATRRIELVSGQGLQSFGQAATLRGTADGGGVIMSLGTVGGLTSSAGVLTDANGAGGDLVARRYNLIDLASRDDTASTGTRTDNRTVRSTFVLNSVTPAGLTVQLLDNGSVVAEQTAGASGALLWQLTNVPTGEHTYTLWQPTEQIPVLLASGLGRSSLTVTVLDGEAPTATIGGLDGTSAVSSVSVTFSEAVTGLGVSDFTLTRDGQPVSLAGATLTGSGSAYVLGNLSGITAAGGRYVLTLVAAGSGVADVAGNLLAADVTAAWTSVAVTSGQTTTDMTTRAGSERVVKQGAGELVLDRANTHTGGTAVLGGTVVVRNTAALGTGRLAVKAGGEVKLDVHAGRVSVDSLELESGGRIDLGLGSLTVAAGGYSLAAVQDMLRQGHAGGWSGGTGITTRSVGAVTGGNVGYVVNPDGGITIGYAANGDTNLDGVVDITDLMGFMTSGKVDSGTAATWSDGDFNHDSVVDLLDMMALLVDSPFDAGSYIPPAPPAASALPRPAAPEGEIATLAVTGIETIGSGALSASTADGGELLAMPRPESLADSITTNFEAEAASAPIADDEIIPQPGAPSELAGAVKGADVGHEVNLDRVITIGYAANGDPNLDHGVDLSDTVAFMSDSPFDAGPYIPSAMVDISAMPRPESLADPITTDFDVDAESDPVADDEIILNPEAPSQPSLLEGNGQPMPSGASWAAFGMALGGGGSTAGADHSAIVWAGYGDVAAQYPNANPRRAVRRTQAGVSASAWSSLARDERRG